MKRWQNDFLRILHICKLLHEPSITGVDFSGTLEGTTLRNISSTINFDQNKNIDMHSVDNKNLNSPKNIPLSRSNAFTSISMHFS